MRFAVLSLVMLSACTAFNGATAEVPPLEATVNQDAPSDSSRTDVASTSPTKDAPATEDAADGTDDANPNPSAPSCAAKHGGMTCGADGKSDCCAVAVQGTTKLAKYQVTAGRMRAFITKVNGDVAGFVKTAATWNEAWPTDGLPTDLASSDVALGPAGKKACEQGANTGHTYWTPKTGSDFSDYDQATLDEKALNCVPWPLAQALCVFDGGHLATSGELRAAFTNNGATKFPWGNDGLDANAPDPAARLNQQFGFETDTLPATFRGDGHPSEVSFFIAPPGRFPKGDNQSGIADAAGNLLEWVGDGPRQFVWKGDFERHGADAITLNGLNGKSIWMDKETTLGIPSGRPWTWGNNQLAGNAGSAAQKDGYYSIGARCAF